MMKNLGHCIFVIMLAVSATISCTKENENVLPEKNDGDTITLLADEIPIDTLGNFDIIKVPTTNANILYEKNICNYLNYDKADITPNDKQKILMCDYLIVNNSDTAFCFYNMIFEANFNWLHVTTNDVQLGLPDFRMVDPFGDPYFKGKMKNIIQDRRYAIEKNIMEIAQIDDNGFIESSIVTYKFICIQKDEKYVKVIIDDKYLIKINILKQVNNNYTECIKRINNCKAEKYIYNSSITTKDFTNVKISDQCF